MLPVCFVEGLQQREMLLSFNKRPQAFFDVSACPSQDNSVDYGFAFLFFLFLKNHLKSFNYPQSSWLHLEANKTITAVIKHLFGLTFSMANERNNSCVCSFKAYMCVCQQVFPCR